MVISDILIFDEYIKVRESLYTRVMIQVNFNQFHIDNTTISHGYVDHVLVSSVCKSFTSLVPKLGC